MLESLPQILDSIITLIEIAGSPVVLGIASYLYYRITKKKADEDQIRHLFSNIVSAVKSIEKELGIQSNQTKKPGELDPRMVRALELFSNLRQNPLMIKASKHLGIKLEDVSQEELQSLFERILHAKKLAVDFDVVKELLASTELKKIEQKTI